MLSRNLRGQKSSKSVLKIEGVQWVSRTVSRNLEGFTVKTHTTINVLKKITQFENGYNEKMIGNGDR